MALTAAVFVVVYALGAGALALWVDVRFPNLAPGALMHRVGAAALATCVVSAVPLSPTVVGLIGVFLPALCFSLLTALWLLRSLAEARSY